jgi:hypothetical protein
MDLRIFFVTKNVINEKNFVETQCLASLFSILFIVTKNELSNENITFQKIM